MREQGTVGGAGRSAGGQCRHAAEVEGEGFEVELEGIGREREVADAAIAIAPLPGPERPFNARAQRAAKLASRSTRDLAAGSDGAGFTAPSRGRAAWAAINVASIIVPSLMRKPRAPSWR